MPPYPNGFENDYDVADTRALVDANRPTFLGSLPISVREPCFGPSRFFVRDEIGAADEMRKNAPVRRVTSILPRFIEGHTVDRCDNVNLAWRSSHDEKRAVESDSVTADDQLLRFGFVRRAQEIDQVGVWFHRSPDRFHLADEMPNRLDSFVRKQ